MSCYMLWVLLIKVCDILICSTTFREKVEKKRKGELQGEIGKDVKKKVGGEDGREGEREEEGSV